MANPNLAARSAFLGVQSLKHPAFTIEDQSGLTIASITSAKGKSAEVKAAVQSAYGVALPDTPVRVSGNGIAFIWHGPDQWMAIAERGAGDRDLEIELKPVLEGRAAVVDQSDGRAVIRVSGSRVRDVLAKGFAIDLHPSAFKPNSVAITHAAHIGCIIWQTDAAPIYEIAMFRSFADSFMGWLTHSAAEYTGH